MEVFLPLPKDHGLCGHECWWVYVQSWYHDLMSTLLPWQQPQVGGLQVWGDNACPHSNVSMVTLPPQPNYPRVAEYCNLWRSYIDIDDSWETTSKILGFYGDNTTGFVQVAGPGQWNDPDMVSVWAGGNG